MSWCSGLEAICRPEVPLRDFTWYRLGGPARWFVTPRDESELSDALARCKAAGVPWRVLGRGANVLVRDSGFDGAVISLRPPCFDEFAIDGEQATIGAGADFTKVVTRTIRAGLAGLEALAGIPGTMGGIIRMNAGGRHGEIAAFVRDVRVLDADGAIRTLSREQVGFTYRHTNLDGCVVLGATLALSRGDSESLTARFRDIWNQKYQTQPPVSDRSAGCVFKNPPGQSAGALVDQAGLKGRQVGGATISPKHANFIVVDDSATAQHVLDLAALAQEAVFERFGVRLEREIEVW
ncbi:MAG: UDP-N-acetylmuramate dehydrogenase [Planctomycetia bacterium]|nr:MAG: UDP-N-acetylmuramate dehydrogenase [Planctomycetia bacterium]